jgi:hypothetical protein
MTNAELLVLLGIAIHGPNWQNAIARDLGVNPRQVNRWVKGENAPRDRVIDEVAEIARRRRADIDEALGQYLLAKGEKTELSK